MGGDETSSEESADRAGRGALSHGMAALDGPVQARVPRGYRDPRALIVLAVVAAPVLVLLVRGLPVHALLPLLNVFLLPIIIASAGEAGGDFEMDAVGVRGGALLDKMTWPYIDRVELADARRWSSSTRVIGRYQNLISIPARAFVAGSEHHPAELVRREAAARGIRIVGSRAVATPWQRMRAPLALLAVNIVVAAVVPAALVVPGGV